MKADYQRDEAIREVGATGELIYLRSLAVAKMLGRDGILFNDELGYVRRACRRFSFVREQLTEANLWENLPSGEGVRIRSWDKYNPPQAKIDKAKEQDAARKRESRRRGKTPTVIDVSARTSAQASERMSARMNVRREEVSPTDDSLRSSSSSGLGGAPPHRAEGAAARRPRQPPSDEVRSELLAARQRIESARKSVAGAGRKVDFRKSKDTEASIYSQAMAKLTERLESVETSDAE